MEIGFIGAGKVGKALGLYFKSHDMNISGYYSKTAKSAEDAAQLTGSIAYSTLKALAASSQIVFITVPDQALEEIDGKVSVLLGENSTDHETVWIHVSGAHPADSLSKIKLAGSDVASMHPLQSFGEPEGSAARLESAWFTIEGTTKGVSAATGLLDKTGGKYSLIKAESKPLYHAGACIVSNFLVTLMESGIRLFEAAGMERTDIFPAITPLIDATLSNIREKGPVDALTGPIVRGDDNTVSVHQTAIKAQLPEEWEFYKAMAHQTIKMLDGNRLTHEKVLQLQHILEENNNVR